MSRRLPNSRIVARVAGTRFPAYTAFACSFTFALAIVLGLVG